MKIQINKNPAGRVSNMLFGLCYIIDGIVRVFSFGFLHSNFTLDYSREQAKKAMQNLKSKVAK